MWAQTFSAGKHYTFRNKGNSSYVCYDASITSGVNTILAAKNIGSAFLLEGDDTNGYKIRLVENPDLYVFAVNSDNANFNVGIKVLGTDTGNENIYIWRIEPNGNTGGFCITPKTGDSTWGSNAWNRRGSINNTNTIGLWSGNATSGPSYMVNDNTWFIKEAVEEGHVYTIKAHFTNASYNDQYLVNNNGTLAPSETTTGNTSYWIAEKTTATNYAANYPWMFRNAATTDMYLNHNTGLSTEQTYFKINNCTSDGLTDYKHLWSPYNGGRNIATWYADRNPWGFGNQNSAGCVGGGHNNSTWTTDYAIEEVSTAFLVESNLTVGGVKYTSLMKVGNDEDITRNHYVITIASSIQDRELTPISVPGYVADVTIDNTNKRIKVTYTFKEGLYTLKAAFNDGTRYGVTADGTTLKLTTAEATPDAFVIVPSGNTNAHVGQPTYYIKNIAGTSYLTYGANLGGQTEVLILDKNSAGIVWDNATPTDGFMAIVPLSGNSGRSLAGMPATNLNFNSRNLPTAYYGQNAPTTYTYSWVIDEVVTPEGQEAIIYNPNCKKYVTNTLASTSDVNNAATFIKVDCGASATYSSQEYPKFKLFVERKGWVNSTNLTEGAGRFGFNSTDGCEFIYVGNDIIPVSIIGTNASNHGQLSWNWHGGASSSNVMGLYGQSDGNSNWQFCKQYDVMISGLGGSKVGGVCYDRVNYPGDNAILPQELDHNALIAMHVSGYNGVIKSIGETSILVAYNTDSETTNVLWNDNDNNDKLPAARIPAIVKSGDYILAFSDWRYNRNDIGRGDRNGHIDIEVRRSHDGGVTWSPAIIAADGDGVSGSNEAGYGDAAVVADIESSKVLMLAAAGHVTYTSASRSNPIRVGKFTSDDNGATWTKSDITESIYNLLPDVNAIFTTSGKILQGTFKKQGSQYRRIYAVLVTTAGNQVIYSDDFGDNWAVLGGDVAQTNGNEAHVTELPNGDILLDSRCEAGGRFVNIFAYSNKETAEGTWGTQGSKMGMGAAGCNGDIDVITGYAHGTGVETKILLQSAPRSGRNNVQYYYKAMPALNGDGHYNLSDFTSGWTAGYEVYHGSSAYSSIFNDGDGIEYMIYERNTTGNTFNYDIVFEKHDISLITNNAYFSDDPTVELTIVAVLNDGNGNTFEHEYQGTIGTLPTVPAYCTVASDGVWAKVDDHYTYTAGITMPFVVSNDENTKYYNIYYPIASGGSPCYLYYNNSNAGKLCNDHSVTNKSVDDAQVMTASEENTFKYSWAIYGDPFTGFTFKNRKSETFISAQGASASGTQNANLAAEGSVFTLDLATSGTYNRRWTMQSGTGYIVLWSWGNDVATYNTNADHPGGHFYIVEAPDFDVMAATLEEICNGYGTTLGTYAYTGSADDLATAQSIVAGETTPTNAKQLKTLITALTNGRGGLNMPQAGSFLRIKSHKFGTYLNSATVNWSGNNNLLTLVNGKTGDNEKTTIMYLTEDNHLVTYATGMGLCNSIQTKTAVGDPYEGNTVLTFSEDASNIGCYNIKGTYGSTNNYLYGYTDRLARNGSVTPECVWELEEVETLPVTIAASGYTTMFSPVSLTLPEGVKAYTADVRENNATVVYHGVEEIPANTGVLLRSETTGVTVNLGTDGTAEEATSSLIGKANTQAYDKDQNTVAGQSLGDSYVYTLQSGTFKYYTGSKLTGFKAHYELQDGRGTGNVRQYTFMFGDDDDPTGIAEIEGMVNKDAKVYDITGRRVSTNAKGILIINGKKVVK